MARDTHVGPHRPGPDCADMFERLSDYLDGELPEDVRDRIRDHIADCDPCVRFVESLRRAVRMVELEGPERLPDDLRGNLIRAAERLEDR